MSFKSVWPHSFSSRESEEFRNGITKIAATKVSAGVSTGIGDHKSKYTGDSGDTKEGGEQFEIAEDRSLERCLMI